ncbi:class III lanthionine synthetase LanKC [Streptomyces sp. SAJ15]|uniref:class III lanthionine synthetase LanKC n=1 Tax=Streptomyces sp. SAJ15 TaxID=2011095 RepID=UPI0011849878|nr:class III lanthionine synthetase LanKC [Streptomyces sp. SAJ15]TVL90425.1 hypothetical protein CD790_20730 [Streptomyces sp. SAJ15]
MDIRYPAYCLASARYYEAPERAPSDDGSGAFGDAVALAPGWRRSADGQWIYCLPSGSGHGPGQDLPAQGWKIHVSATLDNAIAVLKTISAYCVQHGIAFKFLPSRPVLMMRNAKYAPRESSGKFITLYPRDTQVLHRTLRELDRELGGTPAPYILSDLRWNRGPLYVRYGAFSRRYTYSDEGALTPAVARPDGRLVIDHREPRFIVPDWVTVPGFLAEAASRRTAATRPEDFPFDILDVLHFSNGGGVYTARRRRDGTELVLKEGRPHAGLDGGGRDAATRLRAEYAVLSALRGVPGVPRAHGLWPLGGHEFLAMEHVAGVSLHSWLSRNYLNLRTANDRTGAAEYQEAAHHILDQIEETVTSINARGYAFNDLHPGNIMVDDDLRVSLIDFEAAAPLDERRRLGAPGFAAPDHLRGADADGYSLNAVRLFLYVPLSSLLSLCPAKATTLIERARSRLNLGEEESSALLKGLTVAEPPASGLDPTSTELEFTSAAGPWDRHLTALIDSITASATPDRDDRLFPGDINQFSLGGGGVAFGAAGVVAAVHAAGGDVDPWVPWLTADARRNRHARLGLYDGVAGICHVLQDVGHGEEARTLFDGYAHAFETVRGVKLFDGQAGIGLTCLDFYRRTGDPKHLARAERAAAMVATAVDRGVFTVDTDVALAESVRRDRRGNAVENFSGGLLYGWSGPALFMVRMYEVTGAERWLRTALDGVHRDLDTCEPMPDGTSQMRNGGRVLPYLATGSAGVALVCDLVLRHVADDRLRSAVPSLSLACATDFCIGCGLFNGQAGLVYALRHMAPRLDWPDLSDRIDTAVQALNLFALTDEHGLVFPGEQNMRASMDLATGSAGVLRLLSVLTGRTADILPFLEPRRWDSVAR